MLEHITNARAEDVMDAILADSDKFKINLTIEGFEEHLLPLIKNRNNLSEEELAKWFDITKSWTRAIDVYSNSDAGESKLEFTVPALVGSPDMPTISIDASESTHELIQNAIRQESIMPGVADRGLTESLNKRMTVSETTRDEVLAQWAIIFQRYGIVDDEVNSKADNKGQSGPVVEEYEDI